jgi:hypothetical protein
MAPEPVLVTKKLKVEPASAGPPSVGAASTPESVGVEASVGGVVPVPVGVGVGVVEVDVGVVVVGDVPESDESSVSSAPPQATPTRAPHARTKTPKAIFPRILRG